ncbi:MAG: DUF4338 domain-containing protein [Deltaproteobacteria bacterium]|nr:DUF4338 domain-containing protein [Deltaproteobacteria bacterium]
MPFAGSTGEYDQPCIEPLQSQDHYLWDYLVHHYHYAGFSKLVGEHLRYLVILKAQVVACLSWEIAA